MEAQVERFSIGENPAIASSGIRYFFEQPRCGGFIGGAVGGSQFLSSFEALVIWSILKGELADSDFVCVIDQSHIETFFDDLSIHPILHAAVFDQHLHDGQERA
jgi:hypothetical protein